MGDKMVFWIKEERGRTVRLEDAWTCSIYVSSDSRTDLEMLSRNAAVQYYTKDYSFVMRQEHINDRENKKVLKLTLKDSRKALSLANAIEDIDVHDRFRLYNVDVLPSQSYFYEHDIFPLAKCRVEAEGERLEWMIDDEVESTKYELPEFKVANLDLSVKQEGRLPRFTDRIGVITLSSGNETIRIEENLEEDTLNALMNEVSKMNPDFLFSIDGDEWVFPYLLTRAASYRMQLMLSREMLPVLEPSKGGITYFSYGKVHYRPSTVMLYGRIHIDSQNSFIMDHSALEGLYEIARICRMTLHTTARATIGRCLSSLQFYHAHKRGLLVPWKPENVENLKTYRQLLMADRGGLILEPAVGVHEKIAEFDFTSLFPSIMRQRNVSGETVNCDCCPDSKNVVPELGYHICEKHRGIVSEALAVPLDNRAEYKHLKKMATDDKHWQLYDARQDSLKWIGVVSFGYLGHSNSKFGRIDGHIAVCAIARWILKKACRIAESHGFDVKHAIVDSLFAKKANASRSDCLKLKEEIEQVTDFSISYEGEYKWLALLPSKNNSQIPVPNKYYGVFEDGNVIKDRGIETRRHDTPPLFSQFQKEILDIMADGDNIEEVRALMPIVEDTFHTYERLLREGRVPIADLIFTKIISKDSGTYVANTAETGAISILEEEGKSMRAGQLLQYVVTDYYRKNSRKRTVPVELINDKTAYDVKRYTELLSQVCNSVTEPFGFCVDA